MKKAFLFFAAVGGILAVATAFSVSSVRAADFGAFFDDSSLTLRSAYYGRARSADNRSHPWDANEIHVNAFGQGVDFRSGYAWGLVGFDAGGHANLGRGNGNSEVLFYNANTNQDRSRVTLGQAALKARAGGDDFGWEARGGYTPISVGTLGTSGGLHTHAYRGFETKVRFRGWTLGYGRADRFKNEWDDRYRRMTTAWHQNRYGDYSGKSISYVHSFGLRREWGEDGGFFDLGVGEGRNYRRNAQAVVSVPFDLGGWGKLTLTGYGIVAKYRELFSDADKSTEYHVSGQAKLERGNWTFAAGLGHTRAPDSFEMQFRLTAWGNADNRNYIQTWGQLDDFVWNGQNVAKLEGAYKLGEKIGLPGFSGLSVGAKYLHSWNARNPGRSDRSRGRELDVYTEYAVREGRLKGLALGVYAARLRWTGNNFSGKQDRNDVKVIVTYSKTLEHFLRSIG